MQRRAAFYHHPGMRMESNDHRFAVGGFRFPFQLLNDLSVPAVHAIERANCNHGVPERGQGVDVLVNLHSIILQM